MGDYLHVPSGYYVTQDQMLSALVDHRVVFIGETHDNPAAHRHEVLVLRAMAERYPGEVALGMEMFTPSQQEALDRWGAGELSEKEFLKLSGWYDAWGGDYGLYRELITTAKELGVPIIGLNAERSLVKKMVMSAAEELPEDLRATVPEMDLDDPYQRAMVMAIFGDHAHGSGGASGFVRVQTLWDEAMAQNTANYLEQHPNHRMVVVAGGYHVRHGFGIPRRVYRRLPVSFALTGTVEIAYSEEKKENTMDVTMPIFPMVGYDYEAYVEYEETGPKPATLGAMVEAKDGQVVVTAVMPGSPAATVALTAGDAIVRIDETELSEPFDLVYEVKQRRIGDKATLTVQRGSETLTIEVTFTAPQGHG